MKCFHVPHVVLVDMNDTFTGEQMKWSNANIRNSVDWPAVMAICLNVSMRRICSLNKGLCQARHVQTPGHGQCQQLVCRVDGSLSSRPGWRVLLAQEIFGLDRPRHYLAIDAEPIGMEFRPKPRAVQRLA